MMTSEEYTSRRNICPVCQSSDITIVVEIFGVPVHCNVLWPTQDEAIGAPRGDIRLGSCGTCGHIFNLAFDPKLMEYSQAYENSLHFSPRFQRYAESLAVHLIERYDLRHKDVIEIGCGKGEFLTLLCELGDNRGVGFDPSYESERIDGGPVKPITVIQDFYSSRYASYQADLICCRHVLEHIQFPRDFLSDVRHSIGNRLDTVVFFEVPNAMYTLRDMGVWDLIYEHCSYFSSSSLAYLFSSGGFDVCDLRETYGGQFLCIDTIPVKNGTEDRNPAANNQEEVNALVPLFADKYRNKVEAWQQNLERLGQQGLKAVIWGGGSKGVTFLNILKAQKQISYVVDINTRKQGMHVAGTGQKIVPPEFLRDYRPDVIIVMNPMYEAEIKQQAASLGLSPEFLGV